jgi:hypothetical protein
VSGRGAKAARAREARKLRAILEQLDSGALKVTGPHHSAASTRRRLQQKIAELEGEKRRG